MNMDDFVSFVRQVFDMPEGQIILQDPRFIGNERKYLIDAMDSNFVSSVGEYVSKFEKAVIDYTGAKYAIAAVNGTSALHISLLLAGVEKDEEVITQPVSFIATCFCGCVVEDDGYVPGKTGGFSERECHPSSEWEDL